MNGSISIRFLLSSLLFLGFSCNGGKKAQRSEKGKQQTQIPSDFYFKMEKTPCYGTCPIYQVEVFANGRTRLNGKRFLQWIGTHETVLAPDSLFWLYSLLENANLFQYEDRYDNPGITDVPSTIITYSGNGKKKTIFMRSYVPEALRELDIQLHDFFMRQSYQRVEETD